jgi:hypothetical protein
MEGSSHGDRALSVLPDVPADRTEGQPELWMRIG